jgi:hypothetical protein
MTMGSVTINVRDGGLGLIGNNASNSVLVLGACSATNTPQLFPLSQIDDAVTALGAGPLCEAVAHQLAVAGGSVIACPVNASVVGVASAVTPHRIASSNGVFTISGAPYDCYRLRVLVVSSGTGQLVTGGNVAVKVSLDDGATYGNLTIVPSSGTLALTKAGGAVPQNTGLTLAFSVSTTTWDAGDYHTATCKAPYFSTTDFGNAFAVALADPRAWNLVHIVGFPTAGTGNENAIASAAMGAAAIIQMAAAYAVERDARLVMSLPPSSDAEILSAFAAVTDTRLMRVLSTDIVTSVLTGAQMVRGHGEAYVARIAKISASHSPGVPDDGPLPGVVSTTRDERKTPGMYDQGYAVARTIIGRSGVYCDLGRMSVNAGSDFSILPNCRVIDLVVQACRQAGLHFENTEIKVDSNGKILQGEASTIEHYIAGKISAFCGTEYSSLSVTVYVNDNILSTKKLRIKVRVVPMGYASDIEFDVGFENPALLLAA